MNNLFSTIGANICREIGWCTCDCKSCANRIYKDYLEKLNEVESLKRALDSLATAANRMEDVWEENEKLTSLNKVLTDNNADLEEELAQTYDLLETTKNATRKEFVEKLEECIAVYTFRDKSNEYVEGFADALDSVNENLDKLLEEMENENNQMATLLGGDRWEQISIFDDDYMTEEQIDEKYNNPLDDDYIPEEKRPTNGY